MGTAVSLPRPIYHLTLSRGPDPHGRTPTWPLFPDDISEKRHRESDPPLRSVLTGRNPAACSGPHEPVGASGVSRASQVALEA